MAAKDLTEQEREALYREAVEALALHVSGMVPIFLKLTRSIHGSTGGGLSAATPWRPPDFFTYSASHLETALRTLVQGEQARLRMQLAWPDGFSV